MIFYNGKIKKRENFIKNNIVNFRPLILKIYVFTIING